MALELSVIVPCYRQQSALDLTLEALCRQDRDDYEVVVVDDGSPEPITAPDRVAGVPVRVVRQPRDGFGLARARNTGAAAAQGEVLVFLDCDMLPVRGFVSAHLAHHTDVLSVVVGWRTHVEVDGIGPGDVRSAAEDGDVASLFEGRDQQLPTWIERHWERTDDLRSHHHDRWRAMSGGNLSVSKELWDSIGGADESFRQWGGEDNETAYRLLAAGASPVAERGAFCFHQGEGHEPSEAERQSQREQQARLEHLITDPSIRRPGSGRIYQTPQTVVRVASSQWSDETADEVALSIICGTETDVLVELEHDSEWLRRRHAADPRIRVLEPGAASDVRFPLIRAHLGDPLPFGAGSLAAIVSQMRTGEVGAVTVPGVALTARLQRDVSRESWGCEPTGRSIEVPAHDLGMDPVAPPPEVPAAKARRRFGRR